MQLTEQNIFLDLKAQTTKQDTVTNYYQGSGYTGLFNSKDCDAITLFI